MGFRTTRGLRGSTFEETINITNEAYREKGLALIQKIPTSITPVELDQQSGNISLAYFNQKSTVDYMGVVQGIPVCFDAKETTLKSLPLRNIHPHQVEFMQDFVRQKGVAFLLVRFSFTGEVFFLPFERLSSYYSAMDDNGRKSIPYLSFDKRYLVSGKQRYMVHYLEALNTYLTESEEI